jgi:OFA family oxalate/formate antiporter-like MFS transporter
VVEVDSKVSGSHYHWVIVAALFTIWTVVFGIQFSFGIFFRSLQDALGCSRGTIAWAMTIHLLVFALTMVPAGWAIDRFNNRIVYSLAAFGVGLPLALCSQVSETWQLYLLYGLLGVSIAICGPTIFTVLTRWFTQKRGLAFGIASAGAGFGMLTAAPLAHTLIASCGWRNTFLILGGASFIILLVCAQCIKNQPKPAFHKTQSAAGEPVDHDPLRQSTPLRGMTFGQAIRTREIMLIIAGFSTAQITSRAIAVHIVPYATDVGISPFVAAITLSMIGCGSFLGRIVMGLVQDRIGAKRSMIICLISMGVCLFALPFITSDAAFIVFAVIFGLAYGGDVPQVPALAVQCFGVVSLGVIYAFITCIVNLACSLGPLAAGYIFDATHSYTIAFLGSAFLLLLGVFSISRIK